MRPVSKTKRKSKPKPPPRPQRTADHFHTKPLAERAPDVAAAIERVVSNARPAMTAEEADKALEAINGIPPSPAPKKETWGDALRGIGRDMVRWCRWFGWLAAEAVLQVFRTQLCWAMDGIGILVAAMTVYELWHPVQAIADQFIASW